MACQPTRAPLSRSAQPQAAEPDMHYIAGQRRRGAILGKQRDLFAILAALVKRLDRLAPCCSLAVVDLAQIQHMPLHRSTTTHTAVLHDAPVAMLLAIFAANLVAQKHAG